MSFLKQSSLLPILILIIFSLPAIASLLKPGFFLSDDGEWMVIRFSAFHQALADGQFPVRWLGRLNHEYGYPVANFLYPGFMYIAEIPKILGFGFVDSIKIVFGASMIGSAVFSYLWLSRLFGKWAAFIGSLFYLYTPYHLFDLYKRGSVGEVLALGVVPFIFWMIERKSWFLTSIGIAMLILSHNTLALLFLPVLAIYMRICDSKSIIYHLSSIIGGLAISAFFWIPALLDLQYTKFLETQVSNWKDHFAPLGVVGITTFFTLILSAAFIARHFATRKYRSELLLFLFLGSFGTFMSLPVSSFAWHVLPVSFIQFPFRFLSVVVVSIAFLAAYVVNYAKGRLKATSTALLILLLFLSSMPFLQPTGFFDKGDSYYSTNEDTTTVRNEYMPKWVKQIPTERPKELAKLKSGKDSIFDIISDTNRISARVVLGEDGWIQVNRVYFPGWRAFVDGKETAIEHSNEKGVMEISVPKGEHVVGLRFGETPVRLASDMISLIGLIGLISLIRLRRKR